MDKIMSKGTSHPQSFGINPFNINYMQGQGDALSLHIQIIIK